MSGNIVYLLVGQRGAGKSTYAEKILSQQPDVRLISRDVILVWLFGSTDASPYGGQLGYGEELTQRLLRRTLTLRTNTKIIFDYWTGWSRDRRHLSRWLHEHGAARAVAIYFTTPLPLVNEWFWQKPGIAKMSDVRAHQGEGLTFFCEDAPARDYELFHRNAAAIDSDGFDEVIRIDPSKPIIML